MRTLYGAQWSTMEYKSQMKIETWKTIPQYVHEYTYTHNHNQNYQLNLNQIKLHHP